MTIKSILIPFVTTKCGKSKGMRILSEGTVNYNEGPRATQKVISRTVQNPFHRRFNMEPKSIVLGTKKGSPIGTAKEPFWKHYF
jgi:hypothetical protein